jgi:DNA repair protein RadC
LRCRDRPLKYAAILCRGHALKASGFILVHNHPSGDARPSATDVRTTNILRRLSHELDLPLLEHFIIAGDELTTVGGL